MLKPEVGKLLDPPHELVRQACGTPADRFERLVDDVERPVAPDDVGPHQHDLATGGRRGRLMAPWALTTWSNRAAIRMDAEATAHGSGRTSAVSSTAGEHTDQPSSRPMLDGSGPIAPHRR